MLMITNKCDYKQCTNELLVTQDGTQPPGCVQMNNARAAGGQDIFDGRKDFSGIACGIHLNFYCDSKQYNYCQSNGSGKPVGWRSPSSMSHHFCLAIDAGGFYDAFGDAWCQNYDRSRKGINPCV
jgi:hypothetical protein